MLGFCHIAWGFLRLSLAKKIDQLGLWNKSLLVFCLPSMLNNTLGFLRVLSASNKNTCTLSGCWYISTPGALKMICIWISALGFLSIFLLSHGGVHGGYTVAIFQNVLQALINQDKYVRKSLFSYIFFALLLALRYAIKCWIFNKFSQFF